MDLKQTGEEEECIDGANVDDRVRKTVENSPTLSGDQSRGGREGAYRSTSRGSDAPTLLGYGRAPAACSGTCLQQTHAWLAGTHTHAQPQPAGVCVCVWCNFLLT